MMTGTLQHAVVGIFRIFMHQCSTSCSFYSRTPPKIEFNQMIGPTSAQYKPNGAEVVFGVHLHQRTVNLYDAECYIVNV